MTDIFNEKYNNFAPIIDVSHKKATLEHKVQKNK